MQKVKLGQTGITVSRLCFGTLTLSQLRLPVSKAADLIAAALDMGVFFFDTASLYDNYPALAAGLALRPNAAAVVATKTYAYTAADARQALEEARRALNRDRIDIFLLHEQESEHTLRGHSAALEALYAAKAAGSIGAVGLSTHHVNGVEAAAAAKLDVVHPLLNYTGLGIAGGRERMEAAVQNAHASGLGVYSMKALGGGHFHRQAERALAYILARSDIDSVALGMGSIAELRYNVQFFNSGSFGEGYFDNLAAQKRKIWIDPACVSCGLCRSHCRFGALGGNGLPVSCDQEKCILCGYCAAHCPNFFIKIV